MNEATKSCCFSTPLGKFGLCLTKWGALTEVRSDVQMP